MLKYLPWRANSVPGISTLILIGVGLISPLSIGAHELGMDPLPEGLSMSKMRKVSLSRMNVPSTLDWRDSQCITPAEDQGGCGGCYVFAATGAVEAMAILAGAPTDIDISEQEILSCMDEPIDIGGYLIHPAGCQGGYGAAVFEYLKTNDAAAESDFPYEGGDFSGNGYPLVSCHSTPSSGWSIASWNIVQTSATNGIPTAEELKEALQHGPLWVGYMVYDDFYTYWHTAGSQSFPYSHTTGNAIGWHAVLLVGYDDVTSCFICKNSWGENNGPKNNGTFNISYSDNCYFGRDATWIEVVYNAPPVTSIEEVTWGQIKAKFSSGDALFRSTGVTTGLDD